MGIYKQNEKLICAVKNNKVYSQGEKVEIDGMKKIKREFHINSKAIQTGILNHI